MGRRVKRKVEFHKVRARKLITVERDDDAWEDGEIIIGADPEVFRGALVRIRPPGHASDGDIEAIRQAVLKCKPAAIKMLPREAGEAVVDVDNEPADPEDQRPLRQVVMDRAERVKNVRDEAALESALIESCDAAGL
jgi:hypothetical protein